MATIATYVAPNGDNAMFVRHLGGYSVARDGKVITLVRAVNARNDEVTEWRVFRVGRNGMSNSYPTAEKAAAAFGLVIDEWRNDNRALL